MVWTILLLAQVAGVPARDHGGGSLLSMLLGLANQLAISGHFAHRAIGVPLTPALQTAFSKR